MAYREFYQREREAVPDYSPIAQGVSNFFTGLANKQKSKINLADKFNYELKGGFESDQKILGELAKNIVSRATTEIRGGGRTSQETQGLMNEGKTFAETSELQRKRAEKLQERINQFRDNNPYYDASPDYVALQKISDPEVNFQTRGQILDDIESRVGSAKNFKKSNYLADYVKSRQRSYKEKTTGNPDSQKSIYNQSTFWKEDGTPGVTDEHAIDLIKSNPMLDQRYSEDITDEILSEVERMRASGSASDAWLKGKTDDEAVNEIINNPSRNTINPKSYGERKREIAKRDLEKFNAIDNKVNIESKVAPGSGNVRNDAIGHSNTFFTNKLNPEGVSDVVADLHGIGNVGGPGGVLMIKKGVNAGRPIVIEADSRNSFDYRSGKNSPRARGKFNLTGYQLAPYSQDGKLYPISGSNQREIIESINKIPDSQLKSLAPELGVALNGYAIDDSKMLGDIASKSFSLSEQIGDETDPEKKAELEGQLEELNALKKSFNVDGIYDEDIIHSAQKSGIKQVRQDQLIRAEKSDMDKVKTITDGLDLSRQDHWSPEMKAVNEAYKKRWIEANNKAEETKPAKTVKKKSTETTKVSGQSEVDKLPKGTKFIWTDGNEYIKE